MRRLPLALLLVASCVETAYAAANLDAITLTGSDVWSFVVAVGVPFFGLLWKLISVLMDLNRTLTLLDKRVESVESKSESCEKDREKLHETDKQIEREAREGRAKLYAYVNAKTGGTPFTQGQ